MTTDDRNELERLRRQLEAVTAERDRLLSENRRLLHKPERLPQSLPVSPVDFNSAPRNPSVAPLRVAGTIPAVNNDSPLSDKIRLFRSLFRGR